MDRWQRLRLLAMEFEQYGREEARDEYSKRLEDLEVALRGAIRKQVDMEREIDLERQQFLARLDQERLRAEALERELDDLHKHLLAMSLSGHGVKEALLSACMRGDLGAAREILEPAIKLTPQEDEELIRDLQNEALRTAAKYNNIECCSLLLSLGADPTSPDRLTGQSALHCAACGPSPSDRMLKLLLTEDWVREHVNDVDASGLTPLALAIRMFHEDKISYLLSHGANAHLLGRDDWKRLNDLRAKRAAPSTGAAFPSSSSTTTMAAANMPPPSEPTNINKNNIPASTVAEPMNFQPGIIASNENAVGPVSKDGLNLEATDATSPSPNLSLEALSSHAAELFHQGRLEEAMEIYTSLAKTTNETWSSENRAVLFYNAARTAFRLDRKLDSVEWSNKVLELVPENKNALKLRAEALFSLNDFNRAAQDYEALARLHRGQEEEIWLRRAQRARRKLHKLEDLYGLLGLNPTCSPGEIRKAYHEASRKWHPDKNVGSRDAMARATIMFKAISHAYFILGDVQRRSQYDAIRVVSSTSCNNNRNAQFDSSVEHAAQNSFSTSPSDSFAHHPQSRPWTPTCANTTEPHVNNTSFPCTSHESDQTEVDDAMFAEAPSSPDGLSQADENEIGEEYASSPSSSFNNANAHSHDGNRKRRFESSQQAEAMHDDCDDEFGDIDEDNDGSDDDDGLSTAEMREEDEENQRIFEKMQNMFGAAVAGEASKPESSPTHDPYRFLYPQRTGHAPENTGTSNHGKPSWT